MNHELLVEDALPHNVPGSQLEGKLASSRPVNRGTWSSPTDIWVGCVVSASLYAVVWSFEPSIPPALIGDRTRPGPCLVCVRSTLVLAGCLLP